MKKTAQGEEAYTGKSAFKTHPANNPNSPFEYLHTVGECMVYGFFATPPLERRAGGPSQ